MGHVDGESIGGDLSVPSVVVVLGMHRSGTSLCAHVLNTLGVRMAERTQSDPRNPKGYWERLDIVAAHDQILRRFHRGYYDPRHDLPLPAGWWADPRVAAAKNLISSKVEGWLATGNAVGFKDPRTVRLYELWRQISTELNFPLKFVLCLRNPAAVAQSLNKRDGLALNAGEFRWFLYMADIVDWLHSAEVCIIEYEKWFEDLEQNLEKLIEFLGYDAGKSMPEYVREVSRVADEALSHAGATHLLRCNSQLVTSLYEAVRQFDLDPAARAAAVQIVAQFRAHQQLYEPLMREFEALMGSAVLTRASIRLRVAAREALRVTKRKSIAA